MSDAETNAGTGTDDTAATAAPAAEPLGQRVADAERVALAIGATIAGQIKPLLDDVRQLRAAYAGGSAAAGPSVDAETIGLSLGTAIVGHLKPLWDDVRQLRADVAAARAGTGGGD